MRDLKKKAKHYLTKFQQRSSLVDAFNPGRAAVDYVTRYYANKFLYYNKAIKDLDGYE